MVKQEMARVYISILGISELKRTRIGEFNSDDHYIYYHGQEFLKRNGVAIAVNKRVRNAVFECNLKNNRMISVRFQGKPGVTDKFDLGVQNEAGQRLIEFYQENALVTANTLLQQHKTRLYTWTSPDGQHQNQTDYILCSQRWKSSIQSAKTRPGADCGSDHELLIAKFRLKLKKVGKTTRTFRYDLNQIPYDYTMEVTNRFKGLDLIDRVPEEL